MFLTMNAWGNTGIYDRLKWSLKKPLDCPEWGLDETQGLQVQPFPISPFAEVLTSGGSPKGDRGTEAKLNGQTLCFGAWEQVWIQRWSVSIHRERVCVSACVMLKAFQDLSVRKMAVEVSIPCFVSRSLTLGTIIKASTSQKCVSKPTDLHGDDLVLSLYLTTLGHRVVPQGAGLKIFAGTFDAGVRVDGIVGYGTTSLR